MPKVGLMLWDWDGIGDLLRSRSLPAMLEQVNPHKIAIHTRALDLVENGLKGAEKLLSYVPRGKECEPVWSITTYSNGEDEELVQSCERVSKAALDLGIREVCEDAEARLKGKSNEYAHDLVERMHAAGKGQVEIQITTYDQPVSVLWPKPGLPKNREGGHGTFPWRGFFKGSKCKRVKVQVYYAANPNARLVEVARERLAIHKKSWSEAVKKKLIDADVKVTPMVQIHDCGTAGIVEIGEQYDEIWGWAAPSPADTAGLTGLAVLTELADRKLTVQKAQELAVQAGHKIAIDKLAGREAVNAWRAMGWSV